MPSLLHHAKEVLVLALEIIGHQPAEWRIGFRIEANDEMFRANGLILLKMSEHDQRVADEVGTLPRRNVFVRDNIVNLRGRRRKRASISCVCRRRRPALGNSFAS